MKKTIIIAILLLASIASADMVQKTYLTGIKIIDTIPQIIQNPNGKWIGKLTINYQILDSNGSVQGTSGKVYTIIPAQTAQITDEELDTAIESNWSRLRQLTKSSAVTNKTLTQVIEGELNAFPYDTVKAWGLAHGVCNAQ